MVAQDLQLLGDPSIGQEAAVPTRNQTQAVAGQKAGQCGRVARKDPAELRKTTLISAFASSTAVLGSLIPLAVPFLQGEAGVGAIGFIAAMAVSSTIVDVSPFSTNGALVLASAQGVDRDAFFRKLLVYGAIVTVVAPVVVWLLFVVL
jgi:hypothetical protein